MDRQIRSDGRLFAVDQNGHPVKPNSNSHSAHSLPRFFRSTEERRRSRDAPASPCLADAVAEFAGVERPLDKVPRALFRRTWPLSSCSFWSPRGGGSAHRRTGGHFGRQRRGTAAPTSSSTHRASASFRMPSPSGAGGVAGLSPSCSCGAARARRWR